MLNGAQQPRRYTSYERDGNSRDEAQMRRYDAHWSRFSQPDPSDGSYDLSDPQSFNRYAYVQNDPVNFVDPTGLYEACVHDAMTKFLAGLAGFKGSVPRRLGELAGDGPGGADSRQYAATSPKNAFLGLFGRGPSANIHFASEATLARGIANFSGYMALGTAQGYQQAAFVLHSIQDVHGAHQGYSLPFGHARDGSTPDRILGDAKFWRVSNETFQLLSGNKNISLSADQMDDLLNAIIAGCGNEAGNLRIVHDVPIIFDDTGIGGGGGGDMGAINPFFYGGGGGFGFSSLQWLEIMSRSGGGGYAEWGGYQLDHP